MAPRITFVIALALVACGDPGAQLDAGARSDAGTTPDASGELDAQIAIDATAITDAPGADAPSIDAALDPDGGSDAGTTPADAGIDAPATDAGPRVFDVRVLADSACSDLSFDPPSISVPTGTSFTVRWINATGCTEIDIDKDGTVPIVIGLEPGTSYHDTIREWCGTLFTGTFFFRAYYSPTFPYYLDVDCSE